MYDSVQTRSITRRNIRLSWQLGETPGRQESRCKWSAPETLRHVARRITAHPPVNTSLVPVRLSCGALTPVNFFAAIWTNP